MFVSTARQTRAQHVFSPIRWGASSDMPIIFTQTVGDNPDHTVFPASHMILTFSSKRQPISRDFYFKASNFIVSGFAYARRPVGRFCPGLQSHQNRVSGFSIRHLGIPLCLK